MDSKKKKITILSSIAAIIIVAVIIGVIFGVTMIKNRKPDEPPIVDAQTTYSSYTQAITEGWIPKNYKGAYKFSRISGVEFNMKRDDYSDAQNKYKLSQDDVFAFYAENNLKNKNDLMLMLYDRKYNEVKNNDEHLIFNTSSKYTRSYFNVNYGDVPQTTNDMLGSFVGDDELAMVTLKNGDVFFISFKYSSFAFDAEGNLSYGGEKTIDYTKLYVTKNVYSKVNKNLLLFTVTYEYELCNISSQLPDGNFKF